MKIGIYDPYLDTLSGGEKYMLTAAACLAGTNKVSILWDKEEQIKEMALQKLGINLKNVGFAQNIFSSKYSFLQRFFLSKKYDAIIYLSDGSIPFIASNLYLHFQFPVEWIRPSIKTSVKLSRIKKIICNSSFTKNFIDKKFGVRSMVLYPPVPLKKVEGKKENIILHVGRFGVSIEGSNYKKQDVLVDTFKKMIDGGLTGWKFALVVNVRKEDREKFRLLQDRGKGYPIIFVENPPNDLLWEYYAKAKIYWHASGYGEDLKKHPEKAEHFGIATVEAMGTGAVPVVINAGGQKEIVTDGVNGCLWNSPDELIVKTKMVVDDGILMKKLSFQAKLKAEEFSEGKFCTELQSIMQ